MKKLLFIFNPLAGKSRIRTQLYDIVEFYKCKGYLVTVYPTSASGDGYKCLEKLDDSYDRIVCCGGDGTLNEIVSSLLETGITPELGYIPSGSTNDFSRSVGIPVDMWQAMEISCHEKAFAFDVGLLNNRYFLYVAGFGAFTRVSYVTPQKMKNALGYLAYLLQGIKELSELHAYDMSIEYDSGRVYGKFILGLIMNSFSIGGFRNPTSSLTELNDGIFEVILIQMPQNLVELQEIIAALCGNLSDSEHVLCFQTSRAIIWSELVEWTVDGEYGGQYEYVLVKNLKQAVKIFVE